MNNKIKRIGAILGILVLSIFMYATTSYYNFFMQELDWKGILFYTGILLVIIKEFAFILFSLLEIVFFGERRKW